MIPIASQDSEIQKIVKRLKTKYSETKGRCKLNQVCFLKSTGHLKKTLAKIYPIRFPFSAVPGVDDFCYIFEVNQTEWDEMSKAQKHLLVYHEWLHIPVGGGDPNSKKYKKTVPHNVKDFTAVLAKAAGVPELTIDWTHPDAEITDILK